MRIRKEIALPLILFTFSFLLSLVAASIRENPGYMDEAYYYLSARNLYRGNGFTEMILWNYLDEPIGLPHPSHLYWMPFPSIVAAGGMMLWGRESYLAASFLFAAAAGTIPMVTYLVGKRFLGDGLLALFAALFAMFGGYYLVYYSAVESFSLYMLLGGVFITVSACMPTPTTNRRFLQSVCLGVLAGLMHLTRADGILWLTVGFFSILLNITSEKNKGVMESIQRLIMFSVPFLAAYLLVMAPWYYRNFILFQSPGVNGSLRALFLTEYNELYQYPAGSITFSRWLESGFAAILHDRVRAAGLNFLSFLGVQNLVFLLPFTMVGLWNRRKEKITKIVLFSWSSIFLVMSVVFPYAGSRGGFFHSASAVQIWLFLYSMAGFKDLLRILKEKRNWDSTQAKRILGTGFTIIFGVLSFILFINQLGGNPAIDVSGWRDYDEQFRVVESKLDNLGVSKSDVIMVNDPPGYHAATERPCLAIPNGDESVLAKAMEDYHVEYLVLQQNHPEGLRAMYTEQESEYFNVLVREEGYSIWVLSKDSQ